MRRSKLSLALGLSVPGQRYHKDGEAHVNSTLIQDRWLLQTARDLEAAVNERHLQ